MKKILLFILFIFAIMACDLEKAQKEYEKGNYVQSIETTLKYFDKNQNRLKRVNPKVKNEIMAKFSQITDYYTNIISKTENEQQKVNADINLFKIYIMLAEREYTGEFTDFTSKYKAENFYADAEELILKKYSSYLNSGLYDKATEELEIFDRFTDVLKKMDKTVFPKFEKIYENILRTKSDYLLKIAEKYEEKKEYRNAEKLFLKVSETYIEYEKNYRNSYNKHSENKKKADLTDAEKYYEMGKQALNGNGQKEKYRKAYEYFRKADFYVKGYEDAAELADMYYKKGFFSYKLVGDTRYSGVIENLLKNVAYRNENDPELIIEYTEKSHFISEPAEFSEKLSEKTPAGIGNDLQILYRENVFNKITTVVKEKIRTDYKIRVDGVLYKDSYSNSLTEENTAEKIRYRGADVPLIYRDEEKGKVLGKEEMKKLVDKKVKEDIIRRMKIIEERLKRI